MLPMAEDMSGASSATIGSMSCGAIATVKDHLAARPRESMASQAVGPHRGHGNNLLSPPNRVLGSHRCARQQVLAHTTTSEAFSIWPCAAEGYLTPPYCTEELSNSERAFLSQSSATHFEPGHSPRNQIALPRSKLVGSIRTAHGNITTEPSYWVVGTGSDLTDFDRLNATIPRDVCQCPCKSTNHRTVSSPLSRFPSPVFQPNRSELRRSLPSIYITPPASHTDRIQAEGFGEFAPQQLTPEPYGSPLSDFEPRFVCEGYRISETEPSVNMTRLKSHSCDVSPAPSHDSAYGSAGSAVFSDLQPPVGYPTSPRLDFNTDLEAGLDYLGNASHVNVFHHSLGQPQPTTTNNHNQHTFHNIYYRHMDACHAPAPHEQEHGSGQHALQAQATVELLSNDNDALSATDNTRGPAPNQTEAVLTFQPSEPQQTAPETEAMATAPPSGTCTTDAATDFASPAASMGNSPSLEDSGDSSSNSTSQSSPEAELIKPMSPSRKREIVDDLMKEFNERWFQDSTPASWDDDYDDEEEDDDEDDANLRTPYSSSTSTGSSGFRELPEGMAHQHHDGVESSNGSQACSTSSSTGNQNAKHSSGNKRKKTEGDSPDRNGNDGNGGGKRQKNNDEKPSSQLPDRRKLACPYRKRHPETHTHTACIYPGFPTVARVKGHIYRLHMQPPHCSRCYKTFKSEEELKKHAREDNNRCTVLPEAEIPHIEGVTKEMERELRCKKQHKSLNEAGKWKAMYELLFPTHRPVPSPYCDLDSHSQTEERLSPNSAKFAEFEQFNYRIVPGLVRQGIEAATNEQETIFLETLRSLLPNIVREAYTEAQRQWKRQERGSDVAAMPPARDNQGIEDMLTQPPESSHSIIPAEAVAHNPYKHPDASVDSAYESASAMPFRAHELSAGHMVRQQYALPPSYEQPSTMMGSALSVPMDGPMDSNNVFEQYDTFAGSNDTGYSGAGMDDYQLGFGPFASEDAMEEADASNGEFYM